MVRKKKKREAEQVPWCYYCDRVFSDESTLIQHQKAKHFKCTTCHRKLTSASGLRVHCHQVHRFTLDKVPAAIPGKDSIELEVFGMSGVPEGANPGMPMPEEDEPASKAARTNPEPPTPQQPTFSNGMLPGMPLPPFPLRPQPPAVLAGYHPSYGVPPPVPAPGAYPGALPPGPFPGAPRPWPPPPFLRGPLPRLPGPMLLQPPFPFASAPPAASAAPLFPIATDQAASIAPVGASASHHSAEGVPVTPEQQRGAPNPPSVPPLYPQQQQVPPPGSADGGPPQDLSLEELRAQHPKYISRGTFVSGPPVLGTLN